MTADTLQLAQQERARRSEVLASERAEYVLDRVGLSEERCLQLANFERVGPEARKKLKGILDKYRKSAHPFTECVRDNTPHVGEAMAKKRCAVVKDLIMGTTKWRKGPKKMHAADVLAIVPCPLVDDDVAALLDHVDARALAELLSEGDE